MQVWIVERYYGQGLVGVFHDKQVAFRAAIMDWHKDALQSNKYLRNYPKPPTDNELEVFIKHLVENEIEKEGYIHEHEIALEKYTIELDGLYWEIYLAEVQ